MCFLTEYSILPFLRGSWVFLSKWFYLGGNWYTSCANKHSLTSYFLIFIHFFSYLIASAKMSIILNRCTESRHPCLALMFVKMFHIFSLFTVMLVAGLLCDIFARLRYRPYNPRYCRTFILKRCWILSSKAFLASKR